MLAGAARLGAHSGRGRARGEPARLHQTQPALPLYTENDAARALTQLQPVGYNRPVPVVGRTEWGRTSLRPRRRSSFSTPGICSGRRTRGFAVGDETLLFGGDLGRYGRPVLPDPSPVAEADVLLVESTYGDRLHEADDNGERLAAIVNDTVARAAAN